MYPNDTHCWECGNEWNSKDYGFEPENICPNCGTDSRNPVPFFYPKDERADIKENIRDLEWLKKVSLENFIKEKIFREKKLIRLEYQTKQDYEFIEYYGLNQDDEIVRYVEEKYNIYNPSILEINFKDVAREIDLIHPLRRDAREYVAAYAINLGLKALAQHQVDEVYKAMTLRTDKGIDIDYEMKLIKSRYTDDLELELRLKCYNLSEAEFEKIKNEKIKELNEDLEKLRFKIINDIEKNNGTKNFTGMYISIQSSINIFEYIPCKRGLID